MTVLRPRDHRRKEWWHVILRDSVARMRYPAFASSVAVSLAALLTAGCGEDAATATPATDTSSAVDATATDAASAADADPNADAPSNTVDAAADTAPAEPTCKPHKKPGDVDYGCATGTKCIWKADKATCVPAGIKPAGADCASEEECAVGICIQNSAGKSRCSPYCISGVQCASDTCNSLQSGKGKVCDMGSDPVPQCDPLKQTGCEANDACYSTPDGFTCKFAGSNAADTACKDPNDCQKTLACVGLSGTSPGICKPICSTTGGAPKCDAGVKCSTIGAGVGYCDG